MNSDFFSWGWGGMIIGPFMMILFLALFIALIVALVRWLGGSGPSASEFRESSLDILKRRYAAGEIDKEEFEEKRKVLRE